MTAISPPATVKPSPAITEQRGSPRTFFALVFALSVPFWLLGAVANRELFAGIPIAALMFVCSLIAALILVYREDKTAGVVALLKRGLDFRQIRPVTWYVPILLILPGVSIGTYGVLRWLDIPLPRPQFSLLPTDALAAIFFVSGLFEEVGWIGYAIDPMQDRWPALQAGVLLGLITSVWHMVPLIQAGRAPDWIAGWTLSAVASRVLVVWLYNNTGRSVFAAVLFHAMTNLSYVLFPIDGSHFDYRIAGVITAILAVIVTIGWGPRTLARFSEPEPGHPCSGATGHRQGRRNLRR